ncbi:MAG: hypothetical protein ABI758_03310 [Candidatus Woesebacteria bacterium]
MATFAEHAQQKPFSKRELRIFRQKQEESKIPEDSHLNPMNIQLAKEWMMALHIDPGVFKTTFFALINVLNYYESACRQEDNTTSRSNIRVEYEKLQNSGINQEVIDTLIREHRILFAAVAYAIKI